MILQSNKIKILKIKLVLIFHKKIYPQINHKRFLIHKNCNFNKTLNILKKILLNHLKSQKQIKNNRLVCFLVHKQ